MTEGWVIMNANMDQYRAWQNGGTVWVKDLADATFYARRIDAEAVHLDDDAAWRVVRKPLPDGGEAVHARPLSAASAEPKDNLSGPTGEVGGAEPVAWRWRRKCWRYDVWEYRDRPLDLSRHDDIEFHEPLFAVPPSREA